MEALLLKQDELYERIKKDFSIYEKLFKEKVTLPYIEARMEVLETAWNNFVSNHYQLISTVEKSARQNVTYFSEDTYGECQEVYLEFKVKLKTDLTKTNSEPAMCKVKLPPIHLPTFSGKYEEWQSFHDLFLSLIHHNSNLSAVQKFHYLKGSLSGEAENLLRYLPTTGDNYQEAWTQLVGRFTNKRYNCNEVMKRLFAQKSLIVESASGVKQLLDTTSSCLKLLYNLEISTECWDVVVNFIVVSKLDLESRKQWEYHVSQTQPNCNGIPTWDELKKYLEVRFRTLEILEGTQKSVTYHSSFHLSLTNNQNEKKVVCTWCSGQHLLYQCKQFGKQIPEQRVEFVKSKSLCFNCLAPTHSLKSCRSSTCCRLCGRKHHSLLHFERNYQNSSSSPSFTASERSHYESEQRKTNVESNSVDQHHLVNFYTQGKQNQLLKPSWESKRETIQAHNTRKTIQRV